MDARPRLLVLAPRRDCRGAGRRDLAALTHGLLGGVDKLASLAVFLSFTVLSLFFLLKDMPTIGGFVERHLGVPVPLAHSILGRVASSLRGYFLGVTVVSIWSSLLVGAGAMLLGVPLAGTIAVVTFVGGFVPYLGAWTAGVFAVLIALGAEGPETALALAVVVLLANGVLKQMSSRSPMARRSNCTPSPS